MKTASKPTDSGAVAAARDNYAAEDVRDMRWTWHTLREHTWLLALCLGLFLLLGMLYNRYATPLYSATATIQVEPGQERLFKPENLETADFQSQDFLQTVAQSLKARPLLERIAASNHLAALPSFRRSADTPLRQEELLHRLDKMLSVKLRRGTRLIDIAVTHPQPVLTRDLANSLVQEYLQENAQQHSTATAVANDRLLKEAERLRKKLETSEHALQAYKERSQGSSLDERQNTVVAQLKELSTKVTEAKSARIKAESDYRQAMELGSNIEALLTLPVVANHPAVLSSRYNLSKAEDEFAALRQRYKEKHPKYIQALSQLAALRADLTNTAQKAAQILKANLDAAVTSEAALESAHRTQEASTLELSKLAIQYSVLTREVESDRVLYDAVLSRLKETSVTGELQPTAIRIVQPAALPETPVSPMKTLILVVSGLGGLGVGFLLALGLGLLDTSLKGVDQAEALLGLPVLSTIPKLKGVRHGLTPLVMEAEAKQKLPTAGAEAFRTLRTSLSMLDSAPEPRVFLFASALPHEGKTFCALNFAASLTQLGLTTLLIDGDLRCPALEAVLLGQETNHPGLTDYLSGQSSLREVAHPTSVPKLFLVSAGTPVPHPAELLAQGALAGLIQKGLHDYDRVVLDSPPVHAASDTLLMLKHVQVVCLVVRAAHTSGRAALRCVQVLQHAGAALAGVVLNQMPCRKGLGGPYHYTDYYDYRYYGRYSKRTQKESATAEASA